MSGGGGLPIQYLIVSMVITVKIPLLVLSAALHSDPHAESNSSESASGREAEGPPSSVFSVP